MNKEYDAILHNLKAGKIDEEWAAYGYIYEDNEARYDNGTIARVTTFKSDSTPKCGDIIQTKNTRYFLAC